jgi:hypothetical protein
MTTKQNRLDVLTDAKNWWNNKSNIDKDRFYTEYFIKVIERNQSVFTEISDGQLVYMYLHEFYDIVKNLQKENELQN